MWRRRRTAERWTKPASQVWSRQTQTGPPKSRWQNGLTQIWWRVLSPPRCCLWCVAAVLQAHAHLPVIFVKGRSKFRISLLLCVNCSREWLILSDACLLVYKPPSTFTCSTCRDLEPGHKHRNRYVSISDHHTTPSREELRRLKGN